MKLSLAISFLLIHCLAFSQSNSIKIHFQKDHTKSNEKLDWFDINKFAIAQIYQNKIYDIEIEVAGETYALKDMRLEPNNLKS